MKSASGRHKMGILNLFRPPKNTHMILIFCLANLEQILCIFQCAINVWNDNQISKKKTWILLLPVSKRSEKYT
jgi:hypothetical protein